eukprot:scaffold988_cov165-Ochromonas_danica.AAC.14
MEQTALSRVNQIGEDVHAHVMQSAAVVAHDFRLVGDIATTAFAREKAGQTGTTSSTTPSAKGAAEAAQSSAWMNIESHEMSVHGQGIDASTKPS